MLRLMLKWALMGFCIIILSAFMKALFGGQTILTWTIFYAYINLDRYAISHLQLYRLDRGLVGYHSAIFTHVLNRYGLLHARYFSPYPESFILDLIAAYLYMPTVIVFLTLYYLSEHPWYLVAYACPLGVVRMLSHELLRLVCWLQSC